MEWNNGTHITNERHSTLAHVSEWRILRPQIA